MTLSREQIIERIEQTQGAVDLSGLDLRGVDLSSLNLRGADLSRADLTNADLRWTILEGADLHATVLRQADARWSVLRGANMRQADLGRVNLAWADVTGADLTEAKLEGAVVDSVDLGSAYVERRGRAPRGGVPAGGGRSAPDDPGGGFGGRLGGAWTAARGEGGWLSWLPPMTPATLLGLAVALLVLVQFWGWLYRRSYFVGGFRLTDAGLITFTDPANLLAGLGNVVGLTLATLLASPLILLALLLVIALFAAIPVACYLLARRLLRDTVRSPGRPIVVFGLFVAFFAGYYVLIPQAVQAGGAVGRSLPVSGWLGAVFGLWKTGEWYARLGLLAVLVALAVPLWTLWRLLCIRLGTWQPPADWRLRYPALNAAFVQLRGSRLMANSGPLSDDEHRRAGLTAIGIVLGLATVLTFTGRVFAENDMCDGGRLPRVQLIGKLPDAATGAAGTGGAVTRAGTATADPQLDAFARQLNPREFCARLLLETDDTHYVFFPSETSRAAARPVAVWYGIQAASVAKIERDTGEDVCPTCLDGPNGKEMALLDPSEGRFEGTFVNYDPDTGLLMIEDGTDGVSAMRYVPGTTRLLADGEEITDPLALVRGQSIVAYGKLNSADPAALVVDAREVRAVTPKLDGTATAPSGTVRVDLTDPRSPVISGTGWPADTSLAVWIARREAGVPPDQWDSTVPVTQLGSQPDGSFSAPVAFNEQWPTGQEYAIIVKNMTTMETAVGDQWLLQPPPTSTPAPTQVFSSPDEPTPDTGPSATPRDTDTPAPEPTNTPLPTLVPPTLAPGQSPRTCTEPDEFEPDSSRGQQKPILVGIGDSAATQKHNFCSDFDIDLATFPVKGGRWYRVFTKGLAAGVDTVLAVGDLPGGTSCTPWNDTFGCWSDDASALTFESEVTFQAAGDGQAIITVDNRGPSGGGSATYELGVTMFDRGTSTPNPSETPKASPTPTRTPTPMKDSFEGNNTCSSAILVPIDFIVRAPLTGNTTSNRDYYKFELEPGVQYRTEMRPPNDLDYDILVGPWQTTSPPCPTYAYAVRDGDDNEVFDWPVYPTRQVVHVVVYTRGAFDASRPYWLRTVVLYPTPPPPPPPTPTPTATLWPGVTPPPTPEPGPTANPPSATPVNPTVTPTLFVPFITPTPTSVGP